MRILFVVQRYGEQIAGGSEQCCRLFAENLANAGHHVEVATSCAINYTNWENEFPPGQEYLNGVLVNRFLVSQPRQADKFSRIDSSVVWGEYSVPLASQEVWVNEMGPRTPELPDWLVTRSADIDIFIFFTYLYYPTIRGLLAVSGLAPTLFHPTAHEEPHLTVPIFDKVFRSPDGYGFLTVEEAELVNTRFGHLPAEEVLGIGTKTDREGIGRRFREKHKLEDKPFLLYLGRIDPGKGSLEAFEYFTTYKKRNETDLKFVIVGDEVSDLPDHPDIIRTGFISEEAKNDAIDACTIFLQPSYYESFSMALSEAWVYGKPALVQGRCKVLAGQTRRANGGLSYCGFAEFEAGLDLLLEDSLLREELGSNGRSYVQTNYQWDEFIPRYENLIEQTLEAFSERSR